MSKNSLTPRAGITVLAEPVITNGTNGNGTPPPATNGTANGNGTAAPAPAPVVESNGHGAVAEPVVPTTARRADQDQEVASAISETSKIINTVFEDATLSKVLGKKGFSEAKLDAGLALCNAAQERWNDRQNAIGHQAECTELVNQLFGEAVKSYADFRESARVAFSDEASLKALSVLDAVPDDLKKFLTHARGAYKSAKAKPYVTELAEYGYDEDGLDEQLEGLENLETTDRAQSKAITAAQTATRLRDEAAVPVRKFRNSLRKIARRAFRKDPDQARKLES